MLFGLSLAFSVIDFFQHLSSLEHTTVSNKILYIFYIWQEALRLLYPLAIVFALIITHISMVKHNNLSAFFSFGYTKRDIVKPFLLVATFIYLVFAMLSMSSFSYAKEKAYAILKNRSYDYNVDDIFFKYQDTFVYMKKLYPVEKSIEDITIFKVKDKKVLYTIHAPYALYNGTSWEAKDAIVKRHNYINSKLQSYSKEHKDSIETLKGYKPKIIRSIYDGEALSSIDAYNTYKLLSNEGINTDKLRAILYSSLIVPLFSIAMVLILFFKMPYLSRMSNQGVVIASSLGATFIVWGLFYGFVQIAFSKSVSAEIILITPTCLLWLYAIYIYFKKP